MIPAAFDYVRAASLEEALAHVAAADPSVRVLAGGQSLIPLMKLRLARPERLVDVGRLSELRGIRASADGGLAIGAMTTWADLLASDEVRRYGALADVLPQIGDLQVRNRGTIGGSLAHADPASDIAAPALALEFVVVARSAARGERVVAAADLFLGPFATALEPDEILTEVRIPAPGAAAVPGAASAYVALPQQASGYPIAGVAIVLARGGAVGSAAASCRVGVTGVGEQPYRAFEVERAIESGVPADDALASIAEGQRVNADVHADREYRAAMAVVMARRAFALAESRLG
jgi:carbon-monoxide dehydrogenase medium subunit